MESNSQTANVAWRSPRRAVVLYCLLDPIHSCCIPPRLGGNEECRVVSAKLAGILGILSLILVVNDRMLFATHSLAQQSHPSSVSSLGLTVMSIRSSVDRQ
jgi:hypothetical protein